MKKLFLISLLVGILVGKLVAQQTNTFLNGIIRSGTNVTGTCSSGGLYIHQTTGALYNCPSSTHTWTLLTGGSGGGGISDTFCSDSTNTDTCITRGSSAGFLRLYSTTDSSTNTFAVKNGAAAEVGSIGWSGNNFRVGTIGGINGGTARDTIIGSALGATNGLYFATEDTSRWQIASTGLLRPFVDNTYDIGDSTHLVKIIYGGDFRNGSGSIITAGGTCTNQAVTAIAARTGVPTCTTLTSAYTSGLATTAGNLSQFASTTSAQLATLLSDETGSGSAVFSASPTFTGSPVLGTPTATTLNGNTFTTGTYTLTGVAGKTLTFNKSLTFDGTDGTTMTFPTTSATIARTDVAQTFTGYQTFSTGILQGNIGIGYNATNLINIASNSGSIALGGSTDTYLARGAAGQFDIGSTSTGCATAANCRDLRLRHLIGGGTAPTVANTSANSCGTSAATITGTDSAGKITVGATSGTSCTITFGTAWSNAPSCWANDETTQMVTKAISTTTTVILSATLFTAGDVVSYGCHGY